MAPNADFVFSLENELLTSVLRNDGDAWSVESSGTLERFFKLMRAAAPTLPASSGYFNGYGRFYLDCGHIELAACECDSPQMLVSIVERQFQLVTKVVAQLKDEGHHLLLANNNHSGLLTQNCAVWGAHENYMVDQPPQQFTELILPFLVTRIYAGAGGVEHPAGRFVAGVRPLRMELPIGGGTTESRAIHSTSREEHHMDPSGGRHRYHLIAGDGHRSQFNLAIQFAATALTLKAIQVDRGLRRDLRRLGYQTETPWVSLLQRHNVLAGPTRELQIDPLVIATQRVYLDAARRWAERVDLRLLKWVSWALEAWEMMLHAMEQLDRTWLSRRLDAFAKYELYSAVLQQNGQSWRSLPGNDAMFHELALLDHSYHAFAEPNSAFSRLENAGLLEHRIVDITSPGTEATPFVPETATRARARAKLIREKAGSAAVLLDWSWAQLAEEDATYSLADPFAKEFTKRHGDGGGMRRSGAMRHVELMFRDFQQAYDRGQYELAQRVGSRIMGLVGDAPGMFHHRVLRRMAWVRARLGYVDGENLLNRAFDEQSLSLSAIADYCCVFRFQGLIAHSNIESWVQRGVNLLSGVADARRRPTGVSVFRDHVAAAARARDDHQNALRVLELACEDEQLQNVSPREQARLLAAWGDVCRVSGERRKSRQLLRRAESIQQAGNFQGDLAEFTLLSLAKLEAQRRRGLRHVAQAKTLLQELSHRMGLARALLVEARISNDAEIATENRQQIETLASTLPALAHCPRLAAILSSWPAWTQGDAVDESPDHFWSI